MPRSLRAAAWAALSLPAAACGSKDQDAPPAVQAVLAAAQAGDAKAFEAGIDRAALRADLRAQMIALARQNGLDVGGPSDAALDRMIGPDAFHLSLGGVPLAAPPTAEQVAPQLKPVAKDRVCLHDLAAPQACRLTFAKEGGHWRLVGMPADHPTIELAPAPTPKKD